LVPDGTSALLPVSEIAEYDRVFLVEEGVDRFSRITAGRLTLDGPLIFKERSFPLGPESVVLDAFLERKLSLSNVVSLPPALEMAFRLESWYRDETERRRQEAERLRKEEEEKRAREERRQELVKKLGDSASRRELAKVDFAEAAKSALAVGNATFLDHRKSGYGNEMVVRFRLDGQRFECTCDAASLQIISSGICLTAEYGQDYFDEGTKGDSWLTLESLPGVIRQAEREGKLVVFRHAE
jgi:hypothetical protein